MAKRFTDSNKFRDTWYRKLKPKHKCVWEFLLSECDISGIIELDFDSMGFHIGEKITKDDINIFDDRIVYIESDKIFIPSFIIFQQKELNENNKAHKNIITTLTNLNIDYTLPIDDIKRGFEGALKGLRSPTSNSIGNSTGKSNIIKNKENTILNSDFKPTEETYNKLIEEKYSKFQIDKHLIEFKEYWVEGDGKKKKKANWQSVFRNWVRKNPVWANRIETKIDINAFPERILLRLEEKKGANFKDDKDKADFLKLCKTEDFEFAKQFCERLDNDYEKIKTLLDKYFDEVDPKFFSIRNLSKRRFDL